MKDIAEFYTADAAIYEELSRDRNFAAQADAIVAALGRKDGSRRVRLRVLELFAGPAYHAKELCARHGAAALCVDASGEMGRLAADGSAASALSYHVGRLPDALRSLDERGRFDCVLALRYSLGYLDLDAVGRLLGAAHRLMKPGALFIAELHRLDLLMGGLSELAIRERVVKTADGGCVRCVWPNGAIAWEADDLVAHMPVLVEVSSPAAPPRRVEYVSREVIHVAAHLRRLAAQRGRFRPVVTTPEMRDAFPESTMLVLRGL